MALPAFQPITSTIPPWMPPTRRRRLECRGNGHRQARRPLVHATTIADANGNLTTNSYDGFNRLSKVNYPQVMPVGADASNPADFVAYPAYDAIDNLLTETTRAGQTIGYVYDALNRLVEKTTETRDAHQFHGLPRRGAHPWSEIPKSPVSRFSAP